MCPSTHNSIVIIVSFHFRTPNVKAHILQIEKEKKILIWHQTFRWQSSILENHGAVPLNLWWKLFWIFNSILTQIWWSLPFWYAKAQKINICYVFLRKLLEDIFQALQIWKPIKGKMRDSTNVELIPKSIVNKFRISATQQTLNQASVKICWRRME